MNFLDSELLARSDDIWVIFVKVQGQKSSIGNKENLFWNSALSFLSERKMSQLRIFRTDKILSTVCPIGSW